MLQQSSDLLSNTLSYWRQWDYKTPSDKRFVRVEIRRLTSSSAWDDPREGEVLGERETETERKRERAGIWIVKIVTCSGPWMQTNFLWVPYKNLIFEKNGECKRMGGGETLSRHHARTNSFRKFWVLPFHRIQSRSQFFWCLHKARTL